MTQKKSETIGFEKDRNGLYFTLMEKGKIAIDYFLKSEEKQGIENGLLKTTNHLPLEKINGYVLSKEFVKKSIEEIEARSVFELLPAYYWKDNDLRNAYLKGTKETETEWHKLIEDLKKKLGLD